MTRTERNGYLSRLLDVHKFRTSILPQRCGNEECTKRLKVPPTESSLADVEHVPEPAPERALSPSEDHASSAATHGTPETEACATSVPTVSL